MNTASMNSDLLFVLHDVARMMRTRFDQRARAWGMTRAQCVILKHVELHPGACQNDLAVYLELEPISVARLIDRLQASGLVERRADPADRRVHRLHLLPAAGPILAEIARYRAQAHKKLACGVEPAEWDTALKVLLHMKDKLIADAQGTDWDAASGDAVHDDHT